ncbi:MAG: lactate utilization protein B [Longimicrobiales bacterium]
MDVRSNEYKAHSKAIIRDSPGVRDAIRGATVAFDQARKNAYAEVDADAWRRWAEGVKNHTLTHLDRYLEEAEARLTENGCTVHWASTGGDVRTVVTEIARARAAGSVVKGKSMLSEEVDLNPALERAGIKVVETDLGEYILQLLNEAPSHILGPAIHRSLEDVQQLFSRELGTDASGTPDALANAARKRLRQEFLEADMGITGANFVVAESGTIALIENEGNIRLSTSLPKVHVVLVGIEKIIPRMSDLAGFVQLTARAGTGQPIGCFVSLIQGPAAESGDDGPDEVHVVFVDNGRTDVLSDDHAWETLRCVRCGACLNSCPVYRQTGGHAYGWVYSGPIGAVLDPGLLGLKEAMPLPFASTLCGACFDACPVRIPIPELLLYWRGRAHEAGLTPPSERALLRTFAGVATRPGLYPTAGRIGTKVAAGPLGKKLPLLNDWAEHRALPKPSERTFRRLWKDGIQ